MDEKKLDELADLLRRTGRVQSLVVKTDDFQELISAARREAMLRNALKIIAGQVQCADGLMSDKGVARQALADEHAAQQWVQEKAHRAPDPNGIPASETDIVDILKKEAAPSDRALKSIRKQYRSGVWGAPVLYIHALEVRLAAIEVWQRKAQSQPKAAAQQAPVSASAGPDSSPAESPAAAAAQVEAQQSSAE